MRTHARGHVRSPAAWAALALLVGCAADAFAQSPTIEVPGFRVDHWDVKSQLPQSSVLEVTQDRVGFLWIATFGGLARFDGRHFETFDLTDGLRTARTLEVGLGPDEHVWVGFQDRGLQRLTLDGHPAGGPELDSGSVSRIVWSGEQLWVRADEKLLTRTSTAWRVVADQVRSVVSDGDGGVWFATATHVMRATPDGRPRVVTALDEEVNAVALDPSRRAWVFTKRGLYRLDGDRPTHVFDFGSSVIDVTGPLFDHDGGVWLALDRRLVHFADAQALTVTTHPIAATYERTWAAPIRALFEDREHDLWIGTSGAGLWRLSPQPFELTTFESDRSASVTGVLGVAHGFVFGRPCREVVHYDHGVQRSIAIDGCLTGFAYEPEHDALWLATEHGIEIHADERIRRIPVPQPNVRLSPMLFDTQGRRWFSGDTMGLLRLEGDRFRVVDVDDIGRPTAIVEDARGRIWVGGDGHLARLDGDTWSVFHERDGVPPGPIRSIVFTGDDVLIGSYGGGIAVWRGEARHRIDRRHGLIDNFVSDLRVQPDGDLWVLMNGGILRVLRPKLEDLLRGDANSLQGLPIQIPEPEGGVPPATFLDGQDWWIGTVRGLARVRLDAHRPSVVPPPVVIDSATIDTHDLLTIGGPLRIDANLRELRIRFRAPMLRAPELGSYAYRLEGTDDPWRWTTDRTEVSYRRLEPGDYRFHVRAVNQDGFVGPTTTLAFTLAPMPFETTWFRTSSALFLLLGLLGGHRWRTRRIKARNDLLQREVSQRKSAQAALHDRERHYRRVFEASVNGFLVVGRDRLVVDVNPAACEMLGYEHAEMIGRPVEEILNAHEEEGLHLCQRRDGTRFEARVRERSYPLADDERSLVTIVDVSALVESQRQERGLREQLFRRQRVEAMGRLAGGIAHDVNNMLTAVQNFAQLGLEELDDPEAVREDLTEIIAGVARTTRVTKQLLAFGQRDGQRPKAIDLVDAVTRIRPMLDQLMRDDVVVAVTHPDSVPPILADKTHVDQVILNLALNAGEAMPEGGHLEITVDRIDAGAVAELVPDIGDKEGRIRLRVRDEGVGMSEETRAQIFDPFFTTKGREYSSGLGLSVVHGIVAQSNGHILVESAPGEGSTFTVLWRQSDRTPTGDFPVPTSNGARANERILYCDDDDAARRATARVMERAGYDVVVASGPNEALALAEQHLDGIHLLVTDVVMPQMNGRTLYKKLLARRPDLRVLYVSGYSADILEELAPEEAFLPKPYLPRELLARLREILGATAQV